MDMNDFVKRCRLYEHCVDIVENMDNSPRVRSSVYCQKLVDATLKATCPQKAHRQCLRLIDELYNEEIGKVNKNPWRDVTKELPPCDGQYQVTSKPADPWDMGIARYDGYGFLDDQVYKSPTHWRYYKKPEKKYGKLHANSK